MRSNVPARGARLILVFSVLAVSILTPLPLAFPPIERPYEIYEGTIEGGYPATVDPAGAYDIASQELIFNVYDTLLTFDGEHVDSYLPSIATGWRLDNITGTVSPENLPWYYRYVFTIRSGVTFQPPYNYTLTAEDVEYSFERGMVQDGSGGPQWMLYEPLLNSWGAYSLLNDNFSDPASVALVGRMIDHAVESDPNGTVWFNIAYPGAYAPFPQILCQTWGSILSKQWINNYVIDARGLPDWSGNWSLSHAGWALDYTEWIDHHDPTASPLDVGGVEGGLMYGSGPFQLTQYDMNNSFWVVSRFVNHWRGWPANWPSWYGSKPAGYVDSFRVTWAFDWPTRREMFLNGDLDICAVPRQNRSEMLGQDGIRSVYPLPSLATGALFFTFDINPTTPFGQILLSGTFNESGIPTDFFGNSTWGVHVRKAFAYAFDYDTYIAQAFQGWAQHPATAIIPGLPFYDPAVKGYEFNLTRAAEEFQSVPDLWNTGFTVAYVYEPRSVPPYAAQLVKNGIESISPKFHVTMIAYHRYLEPIVNHQIPLYEMGWLGDYPDPHNLAYAFYHSQGSFAPWQVYHNPVMDCLVNSGAKESDPVRRAAIYHDIQVLAIEECPNTVLYQPLVYHFERDWVCGWYNNPGYPGVYAYNLWKWYYIPHSLENSSTQPTSNYRPADVNYDGKVDIKDVSLAGKSFGASVGPPLDPRWIFICDFNNDGKINIKDISYAAKYFGKKSQTWIPTPTPPP